jgi:serine/threonine protein kinase
MLAQVEDKLYIYLEYVSGGSIYKLLQEYGQFGEIAIRSYTQQILSGLAYLHVKNTLHRLAKLLFKRLIDLEYIIYY